MPINPLQYPCLENPMDGGAWKAAVHGVTKSRTQLNFPFTFHFPALEKEMATDSSVLACRIPGTGEPGGLPSMGSHRVGHDWSDLAAAFTIIHSVFNEQIDKGGKNLTTGFYLVISNNHINKKVIARTNVVICVWFVYTFLM